MRLLTSGAANARLRSRRGPRGHPRAVTPRRTWSWRRLAAGLGVSLAAFVLVAAVLLLVFGGAILNGFGKAQAEGAFAQAHPGFALQIGTLEYAVSANCLLARSVTLSASNTTLRIDRISLTGVRWLSMLWGSPVLAEILAQTRLEATNLEVGFAQADYGIRCGSLRASVPGSDLVAENVELRPLIEDEAFFAAHDFRTARFRVIVPECRVSGLAPLDLLTGTAYRAGSVHFDRPTFDALVNCDKPSPPSVESPLMVHEALAAIQPLVQIGSLTMTDGQLRYGERRTIGADPAELTLGAVRVSVLGIGNRGEASAAIQFEGQGDLMNAGTLKVRMSIPIRPPDFSLQYSGSLSAMDLTRLDAFLDTAEYLRIKSGTAQEAEFHIEVTAGQAHGWVRAIYGDLEIAVLDQHTGTEKGIDNRVTSFLANVLKIRNANAPDASGAMKLGEVKYTRRPDDQFQQFVWFALRTGVLDVISH